MTSRFVEGTVRVRVPATSANLGPGFDALGLALTLHDDLVARVTDGGLAVDVHGEGAGQVAQDESHLVVRAMYAAFDLLGGPPPGFALHCENRIPHSRGLGSSAAAIVGGLLLARALVVDGDTALDDTAVLHLAAALEGHPDNVAPCLLGGLTIAWTATGGGARAVRREPDPSIVPVVMVPPFAASTAQARGLLPAQVPHTDAAFNAARSALLVAALTGTPQALVDATEERLHQQYRVPAMPESAALVASLRADGLAAVVSGAGPTVLVLARGEVEAERARRAAPPGWVVPPVAVDLLGAHAATAGNTPDGPGVAASRTSV
ncbi:homoserine kinase [Jatrophihabitans fulvus]